MFGKKTISVAAMGLMACLSPAKAFEPGSFGYAQKPGLPLGNAAVAPPPGIYMFDQVWQYNAHLVGPGAPVNAAGGTPSVYVTSPTVGFLFVPGWTFLGATYDAVIAQPYGVSSVGSPINLTCDGVRNTFIAPIELSWNLGNSGFFVKAGLGIHVPDGTVTGLNGLGSIGTPWWTFQPNLVFSYFKDGWNLTVNLSNEMNTASSVTGYKSGDVFHADFTATKAFGKWTVGPVASYATQITDDQSSPFYRGAIGTNRFSVLGVGGLVSYNFGPATLKLVALEEVTTTASSGTPRGGVDSATITKGFTVFANLSYQIWSFQDDQKPQKPQKPQFTK
ncbi:transporter [Bradyrhizobium sp. TZ2]|jgi:hypothetical protein